MHDLQDFSETEDHPLSFVGQVRREVAGRVMTDYERRLRDACGRCDTCGGPYSHEPAAVVEVLPQGMFRSVNPKRCQWCGLSP